MRVEEQFGQLGEKRVHLVADGCVRQEKRPALTGGSFLSWLQNMVRFVLLPQGYPSSVSDDYLEYQLWDTLQAFCSYLSGTLTTKAVMQGVGVGDAAATPLAATITWILKDGTGMIGRILFATWKGPELDTNCKKWRLAADILNDMAMSLELCSPLLPDAYFATVLCLATSMKAIVGVAGGATRAALTQHQARQGNMADVAAKDGSQETLVNLIANNIGLFLLPLITKEEYAWFLFVILTCTHLFANYRAVCCLNIPILNEQRFNILYLAHVKGNSVGTREVNSLEPVIIGRSGYSKISGCSVQLGASLSTLPDISENQIMHSATLSDEYLLLVSPAKRKICVVFKNGATPDALKAYFNAQSVAQSLGSNFNWSDQDITKALSSGAKDTSINFNKFKLEATKKGWLMDRHQLLVDEWTAQWNTSKDKDL